MYASTWLPSGGIWADITSQGFYDPINERLIEPKHTGISYSFTADGFYEAAYYRAIANRTSAIKAPSS
jgi:hypothetical protein